ncbi:MULTISPECIES: hypothetical protein [Acinetobacter calcoaceticus/baumannii complex]|uniref:hypothetical protein n=2 Tax=Moraxellaceae TaxID=468 RepID=UPI001D173ED9|nr:MULTISPECIES: hypothetical protein [Acinetobacter calcoaceticus/baumannii complex]
MRKEMFGIIESLTKATVSAASTVVTATVDTVMIPVDSANGKDVYGRTAKAVNNTLKSLEDASKPVSEK